MASLGVGSLALLGGLALLGCGSVAGGAVDASDDHATGGSTGSAGATAGSAGAAGASTGGAGSTAGSTGAAGMDADRCEQDADCASGVCWQQLDGLRVCVAPTTPPVPVSCEPAGAAACCAADADCTDKAHGHCVPKTYFPGCGGAIPQGNACTYDQCATDADCKAGAPAGAPVATCLPAIQGRVTKTCAYGACRTNADCTKHPGGACQYDLGPTHGNCVLVDVFFCAYPSDPCPAQACPAPMQCVPNDDFQGRQCGPGQPQYP